MTLKLMYITNDVRIAKIAEESGVDWIFIDLEINGKEARQGHLDTVISRHSIEDISKIKSIINKAELLVRVNPIYDASRKEIDAVIDGGADIIMLPYFKSKEEVKTFIDLVGGRVKTCLLLETPEAVENLDLILKVDGIDYIHIGLNDLHLGYGMKFMFEVLTDGIVEKVCQKIKEKKILYGFGGIARLGKGLLTSDSIIAEHYRLGSSAAILSRSFCDVKNLSSLEEIKNIFRSGIKDIRDYEKNLLNRDKSFFDNNKRVVREKVIQIISGDERR